MTGAESQVKAAVYRVGPRTFVPLERGQIGNFTDPITNQTSLSRIDIRSMLKKVDPSDLPLSDQGLRFFLHEVTHHASFANSVGNARAALATSVCGRASVGAPPTGRAGLWLAQRDDIVLRFFEMMIEPLVEGLALFAEHDIRWGKAPFASHPMLHLWSLFLSLKAGEATLEGIKGELQPDGGISVVEKYRQIHDDWINDRLMGARTRDYWVEQKALLLRQPLLGASGPAYLLGYLAIKRAYLVLRDHNRGFFDTDVFLLLMMKYWFSDARTTELLVRFEDVDLLSVQETIGEFAERFQGMWDELYRDSGPIALRLIAELAKGSFQEVDPFSSVGLSIGLRTAADSLNIFVPRFFKHRLVLRLGMIRVNIASDRHKRTAVVRDVETNEELLQCPLVGLSDTGDFPGSIEIVRTYDGRITAIVVLGGSGLIAVRNLFGEDWNEPDMIALFDDLPSLEYVEASAKAYGQSAFARGWEEEDFRDTNEHIMNQAKELCVLVYLQLALRRAAKDQRAKAVEMLGTAGFAALFPDRAELNELALLSLHFGGPGTSIDLVAKKLERPVKELVARLESFNVRSQGVLGIDLFEVDGGLATAAI
jgi:hypothetical protein